MTHMAAQVLLADQSTTIQRVVELALASEKVSIVPVGDGERAIEVMRQAPPDLVLVDISTPKRTGYDVAEWIRSQPRLAHVPILLLAAAFEPVDAERARRVGADGVLTKPLDPTVLVSRVMGLLATGRELPDQPAAETTTAQEAVSPTLQAAVQPVPSESQASARPAPQASTASGTPTDSDALFDHIDRAFAELGKSPRPPLPPAPERQPDDELGEFVRGRMAPTPVPAPSGAPLGDAFATLLDAERTGAVVLPLGRISLGPAPAVQAPPIDVDALADQIARRVLAQLSDVVVRETVSDVVAATAERLVREEIDRIKRNIT